MRGKGQGLGQDEMQNENVWLNNLFQPNYSLDTRLVKNLLKLLTFDLIVKIIKNDYYCN